MSKMPASKSLTDEYKKLAEDGIPDLWGRIETGITAASKTEEKKVVTSINKDFEAENLRTVKLAPISYQNRHRFVRRYGGLLAACLCAAIIIPVLLWNRNLGNNFLNDSAAPATEAAPQLAMMVDMADVVDEISHDDDFMVAGEASMPESEVIYSSFTESQESEADGALRDENIELYEALTRQNTLTTGDAIFDQEEARKKYFRTMTDEKVIEISKVTIEIVAEKVYLVYNGGLFYEAIIIADESETLNTGINIYIRNLDNYDFTLNFDYIVGETYQVDLSFYEMAAYCFTVLNIWPDD
ncbi:MAG: hypothetical protein FWE14_02530 [Lachnospiraceae bacterium]|nr:hypothetical protein [Lachnospiraceae bacterium]